MERKTKKISLKPKTPTFPKKMELSNAQKEKNKEIRITDLLKCPICKKICLMNIDKNNLLFSFECNNNHSLKNKISKNSSLESFNKNINEINLSVNKDNNTSCKNSSNKSSNQSLHLSNYTTEKDFYCSFHPNLKYQTYCYECKENMCIECKKKHINHTNIDLNLIKPKENEIISCKKNIENKFKELNETILYLLKWKKEFEIGVNNVIKIMQNIHNLRQFIIMNYDSKQCYQNYNYIQNFNNMKKLDCVFPELQEFLNEYDWKNKGYILIGLIN